MQVVCIWFYDDGRHPWLSGDTMCMGFSSCNVSHELNERGGNVLQFFENQASYFPPCAQLLAPLKPLRNRLDLSTMYL